MALQDKNKTFFLGEGISSGALQEMHLAWLKTKGATSNVLDDARKEYMVSQGFISGSLQDREGKWLTSLGFTGTISDKFNQMFAENLTLIIPLLKDTQTLKGTGATVFTRASIGTSINDGLLTQQANDVARFESNGYLSETSSENLILHTEAIDNAAWIKTQVSIDDDSVIAPDGELTADLAENTASSGFKIEQFIPVVTGNDYTMSGFAKSGTTDDFRITTTGGGWVGSVVVAYDMLAITANATLGSPTNVGIKSLANGWSKIFYTTTTVATVTALTRYQLGATTGDNLPYFGMQVEKQGFASSYIPTTAAAITRAKDVLTYPLQSGEFNEIEGTVEFECDLIALSGSTQGLIRVSDGTTANRYEIRQTATNLEVEIFTATVSQGIISVASLTPDALTNIKLTYKVNDVNLYVDGTLLGTDSSVTLPTGMTTVDVLNFAAADQANGHIKNIKFFDEII